MKGWVLFQLRAQQIWTLILDHCLYQKNINNRKSSHSLILLHACAELYVLQVLLLTLSLT